jgi:hypothetical protein
MMPFSNYEFHEDWHSRNHNLCMGIYENFPYYTSTPIWLIFGTKYLHVVPLSSCGFCENWCSKRHNLLGDINETLPILCTFSSILGNSH